MATGTTRQTEALVRDDITRAWDWLERWGHDTDREPLTGHSVHDLIAVREREQGRVLALAETWQTWWTP